MVTIIGGRGYVGTAFRKYLGTRNIDFQSLSRGDLDYTSLSTLQSYLECQRPEFVINCAGYTGKPNVDACELDKANCLLGNAVLPGIIREACESMGIPFGHVSSGCIFSGRREDGQGFDEKDIPNFCFRTDNCSFYSGCKTLGEEALGYRKVETQENHFEWKSERECGYVWRLRIPFNEDNSPRNYLYKLMHYSRLLDVENSISQLDEFVAASWLCWERKLPMGIYNITNPGPVTTREVVELIREAGDMHRQNSGHNPFPQVFSFFASNVEFMQTAAKTARSNCVLDTVKLETAGIRLTPAREAVRKALMNFGQPTRSPQSNSI